MTGVIIVDDHTLFREGLRGLLDKSGQCSVVAVAGNGREFLDMVPGLSGEVILMDIDMPVMNGMDASAEALAINPGLKIITLSMHGDEDYYFRMVSLGVKGFLLKSSPVSEVVAAVQTVADGGSYFSQELLTTLVGSLKSTQAPADVTEEGLSQRELEILPLICQGLSNAEIADTLFISKRTVDKHRANILAKTGCRNTASLVFHAIKNGLVEL